MVEGALGRLGDEHASWLLVAAHNEIRQRRPDRAATLLELLEIIDPDNAQCGMLLAYAYWLQEDVGRAAAVLDRTPGAATTAPIRAAIERLRLGAAAASAAETGRSPDADGQGPPR